MILGTFRDYTPTMTTIFDLKMSQQGILMHNQMY